ncbi:MAG: glycosyltransferase family 2 protein [Patescibacteria group bacterium]
MKVITVVLSFNSRKYIHECLESLKGNEVVVVDAGSTDGSPKYIAEKFPDLKLIVVHKNLGYAGGNNLGIKYALESGADLIWIVNPDIVVAKDALNEAIKVMTDNVAVVASKVYFAPGYEFHKEKYKKDELGKVIWYAGADNDWNNVYAKHWGINEVDLGQYNKQKEIGYATGSSMLLRSEVLKQTGLIDERYFMYYEENDLCQKIKHLGFKLVYAPKSVVWHKVGQAAGIGSNLADYYIARNRMLFGMHWAPWRTKIALVRESIKLLFKGRPWQKIGIRDFYLGKFGKGSYA